MTFLNLDGELLEPVASYRAIAYRFAESKTRLYEAEFHGNRARAEALYDEFERLETKLNRLEAGLPPRACQR